MEENKTKKEHILVCISSSPSNPKVIKAGKNMAEKYNANFTALYIETSNLLDKKDQNRLEQNIILAKNLGAKIVTLNGSNIYAQVADYAKKNNITKLIIGRNGYKPNRLFSPPNFIDRLITLIPEIEIYIIPDKIQKVYLKKRTCFEIKKLTIKDFIISFTILILATLLGYVFHNFNIHDANIVMAYILAIAFIACNTKSKVYSILSSFIAVCLYDFFFVEPFFSLHFNNKNYTLTFLIMLIVAIVINDLAKKLQKQVHEAFLKTYRTEALFDLSQKLQDCITKKDINFALIEQLKRLLECDIELFTQKNDNEIINSVFESNKIIKQAKNNNLYIPISNNDNVFGVIKIDKKNINNFEKNLISAMIRETVLALEKNIAKKSNEELLTKNQQEKLRTTLLRAISHDLRTPLTGICGYSELLINNSRKLKENKKIEIYNNIYYDSSWLLNLIENLLSITRFDKDKIEIKKEIEFIPDVISFAISHLGRKKNDYNIKTIIKDEDLYAEIDGRLIIQVIFNLIDNAMKYSKINSTIEIKAEKINNNIKISVCDNGCGINDSNKEKVFDLFYTITSSSTDSRRGLGLGLSLCKTIIEAHNSKLKISNNIPNGTIVSFELKEYKNE